METTTQKTSDGELFRQFVKGSNLMTPRTIGYYPIKNGEAELTTGNFLRDTLYGVTVVQNNRKDDDLSKCCHSMDEAMEYIKTLQS